MINYLTHYTFAGYNENLLPTAQPPPITSGGVATKTNRVMEALRNYYPTAKCITKVEDIDQDFVLIEPLFFTIDKSDEETVNDLEILEINDARKILYCSEKSLVRMKPDTRNRLFNICDVVTTNCAFQRNVFRYIDIENVVSVMWLCDPIPAHIYNCKDVEERTNSIMSMGYIAWHKNVDAIIKDYEALEGIIERKYIGSNQLWSNVPVDSHNINLQTELQKHCDSYIPEANRAMLAEEMRASRFGLWHCYHDTFAFSVHEMLMCGVIVMASQHGLANELPVTVINSTDDLISAIKRRMSQTPEELDKRAKQVSEIATKRASFDTFLDQFTTIIRSI